MIYRSVHNSFTQTEVTARVVDAVTKQVGNEGRWFVYIQPVEKTEADTEYTDVGDPLVVEVSDTYLYGKFNSSDRFFELKQHIGTIYHFTLQGERNAFWSTWQNIVEYTPVSQ